MQTGDSKLSIHGIEKTHYKACRRGNTDRGRGVGTKGSQLKELVVSEFAVWALAKRKIVRTNVRSRRYKLVTLGLW